MLSKIFTCLFVACLLQGLGALPSERTNPTAAELLDAVDRTLKRADVLFEKLNTPKTKGGPHEAVDAYSDNPNVDILKCLAEHGEELRDVIEHGKRAIRACLCQGEEKIAELREKLEKIKQQAVAKAVELQKIFIQCHNETAGDPAAIEKCVIEKGQDVIDDLVGLLVQFRDAIIQGEQQLHAILAETRNCVVDAVNKSKEELAHVITEIHTCIAESY